MAGRGPAPKPADKRVRRNAAPAQTEIPADAKPKKPPKLPGGQSFLAETRRWYRTWATSPHATQFAATDWQRLHMLALLVDDYFRIPRKELLSEIRLNESLLGATPVDRQRLSWAIVDDPPALEEAKSPRSSRRRPDPRLRVVK